MADIVNMPKLGFDMAEGTLVRWVVNEGEKIETGDVLAEIETDKATVEVESNFSGVLLQQLVEQGTVVPINDPIAVIGKQGEKVNLKKILGKPADNEEVKTETEPAEVEKETKQKPGDEEPVHVTSTKEEPAPEQNSQLPEGVRASPLARSMAADFGTLMEMNTSTICAPTARW